LAGGHVKVAFEAVVVVMTGKLAGGRVTSYWGGSLLRRDTCSVSRSS